MSLRLFACFAFFSFFVSAKCCTCKAPNVTHAYCKSDFVSHVIFEKVVSNVSDPFHATLYQVKHVKVYKATKAFENLSNKRVVSTPPGPACGVDVNINSKDQKEWVLFGTVSRNEPFVNVCSPNAVWTEGIRENLEKGPLSKLNCELINRNAANPKKNTKP